MQTYKVIQGEEKKIDQKYEEEIGLYGQMVDLGQESFLNSELILSLLIMNAPAV